MLYAGLDLSRKRLDFHLLDAEGATVDVGASPAEVGDTTGAGDLFIAAYVWADLAGHPLEERLQVRHGRTAAFASVCSDSGSTSSKVTKSSKASLRRNLLPTRRSSS